MNPVIEKLLSQVYELEGLLTIIDRHGADSTPYLYEMVQKKVELINEYAPYCTPEIYKKAKTQNEVVDKEEIYAVVEEETVAEVQNEEIETEEQDLTLEEEPVAIVDEIDQVEDDGFVDYLPDDEVVDEASDEDIIDEPIEEVVEDILEDDSLEVGADDEDEVTFDELVEDEKESDEPIRLDEALQRSLSKDLSKAFSLNDRFRYRRELFGNSEVEMRNTIDMVEAMHSFSEAEDYFYGDLEWDRESPEVADFMTIIKNHFL